MVAYLGLSIPKRLHFHGATFTGRDPIQSNRWRARAPKANNRKMMRNVFSKSLRRTCHAHRWFSGKTDPPIIVPRFTLRQRPHGTKLSKNALLLRFSNENSYLNWARNGVLSTAVGVAMYDQVSRLIWSGLKADVLTTRNIIVEPSWVARD